MEISMLKLIMICVVTTIVWDFFRLLVLKFLSKRMRVFAIVPDSEQLRLKYVSQKLNIEVTDIVVDGNIYYDINNPNETYRITCTTSYLLQKVDENGDLIEESDTVVEPVETTEKIEKEEN